MHLREEDLPYVLKEAEQLGLNYDDVGKKELVRRLLIDGGLEALGNLHQDGDAIRYTVHKHCDIINMRQ